jgi:hypothetical protein
MSGDIHEPVPTEHIHLLQPLQIMYNKCGYYVYSYITDLENDIWELWREFSTEDGRNCKTITLISLFLLRAQQMSLNPEDFKLTSS